MAQTTISSSSAVRVAQSTSPEPAQAVLEVSQAFLGMPTALIILFCSSRYQRQCLQNAIQQHFNSDLVIGCTTSGEIGPLGLSQNGLCAIAMSADYFDIASGLIPDLPHFNTRQATDLAKKLIDKLEPYTPNVDADKRFALLLIDGLSTQEETVAMTLQNLLGNIPLIGGSAGDDLAFHETSVFFGGAFHPNSAVLVLAATKLPFVIFKTQHFEPAATRIVVTAANADKRIVYELNGRPAAEEYAHLLGIRREELTPEIFAASPLVVMIGQRYFVRSIQQANDDDSLTLYCAIEEGLVLRVVHGVDMLNNLAQAFAEVSAQIGQPLLTISCDCILRKLEALHSGKISALEALLRANHCAGFNTYGEQIHGIHVNQTFAAIAFGQVVAP